MRQIFNEIRNIFYDGKIEFLSLFNLKNFYILKNLKNLFSDHLLICSV